MTTGRPSDCHRLRPAGLLRWRGGDEVPLCLARYLCRARATPQLSANRHSATVGGGRAPCQPPASRPSPRALHTYHGANSLVVVVVTLNVAAVHSGIRYQTTTKDHRGEKRPTAQLFGIHTYPGPAAHARTHACVKEGPSLGIPTNAMGRGQVHGATAEARDTTTYQPRPNTGGLGRIQYLQQSRFSTNTHRCCMAHTSRLTGHPLGAHISKSCSP